MSLPCGLLDTLLFLRVLCRLLDAVLPSNLLLLLLVMIVVVLLLSLLLLRLGMLLWLCLSMLLLLRLGVLLWLCLSMLLLLRLGRFLLLLLLWLGFLLSVLCERRNNGSERQKQDCCSETCKCFHWYCLNYKSRRRSDQ